MWETLKNKKIKKPDPWNFDATFGTGAGGTGRPSTAATRRTNAWEETEVGVLLEDEELGLLAFEVLFYGERNVKKALELASEAVRSHAEAKNREAWTRWRLNAGKACGVLGLSKDAENHFRIVLNVTANIEAFRELARVYYMQNDFVKSTETLNKARELFPKDPQLLGLIAKLTYNKAAYMEVVKLDPSNRGALLALGAMHFEENEPETALKFFQRVLELHGPSAELWNNIALAAVYSNQTDVGIPAFEQAIISSEGASRGDIWFNVASFAVLEGDVEFARVALKLASTLNPSNAEALVNLALLDIKEENLIGAKELLDKAISVNPNLFEAKFNCAFVNYRLSHMDVAFAHIEAALRFCPGHPQALTLRSLIKAELTK